MSVRYFFLNVCIFALVSYILIYITSSFIGETVDYATILPLMVISYAVGLLIEKQRKK